MRPGITAVIATHPERMANGMLTRALESVAMQTCQPDAIVVENDPGRTGAAATRNRALARVDTLWTAFLDSDDWWFPEHLAVLVQAAKQTQADYLYSYPVVHDRWEAADASADPLGTFGQPFNPDAPQQTTITILVRTPLLLHLGGFIEQPPGRLIDGTTLRYGEDYDLTVRAAAGGADVVHVAARTWAWRHHPGNSSGLTGVGDAPMPDLSQQLADA